MTDRTPTTLFDCTCLPLNRRLSVHEQGCVERAVSEARADVLRETEAMDATKSSAIAALLDRNAQLEAALRDAFREAKARIEAAPCSQCAAWHDIGHRFLATSGSRAALESTT